MTGGEVRQALRVRRNARAAEALLFQVIDELHPGDRLDSPDWSSVQQDLLHVQQYLQICVDLVRNAQAENG